MAHTTPHVQHVAARSGNAREGATNLAWASMDVYTHPVSESERDAVARLGEVLFPNVPNFAPKCSSTETGGFVTQ